MPSIPHGPVKLPAYHVLLAMRALDNTSVPVPRVLIQDEEVHNILIHTALLGPRFSELSADVAT
jgi:hypothetical protein